MRGCVNLVFVLCLTLASTWARAVEATPAESTDIEQSRASTLESLPLIEMHVVGSSAARQGLERLLGAEYRGRARIVWALLSIFDRQQILARLPDRGARIHCWIDLTEPGLAHLYFVVPTLDRFMMRDLALEQLGSFEFESLAQIIELSLEALLTDEQAGISREQAQSVLNPAISELREHPASRGEPVRLPEQALWRFAAAGRYSVVRYSAPIAQHGPGISVAIERINARVLQHVALSSSFYLPQRVRNEAASASIAAASLSLELAQLWALGVARRHHWGPRLGIGVAVVQATPFAGDLPGSYELLPRTRRLEYHFGAGLAWRVELGKRLSLQTDLSLNVAPKPLRHEFVVDEQPRVMMEGLVVRPALGIALFVH